MVDDDGPNDFGRDLPGGVFGLGNAADHHLNERFQQRAREILTGDFRRAAREAEDLLNGFVTGRENPLPPAPFELERPSANAADQTAQFLRPDFVPNGEPNAPRPGRRRRTLDPAGAPSRDADRPRPPPVPIPDTIPVAGPAIPPPARRASLLAGLFDMDGRSQTAAARAADRRIENWRNDVPPGEPAADRRRPVRDPAMVPESGP